MKELEFLHFHPGHSIWHRHDPRFKLIELAAWSILALSGNPWTVATVGVVLIAAHGSAGTSFRRMVRPLLFWTAMAAAIIAATGFSDTGSPHLTFGGISLPLGRKGLLTGALSAGRLLVVLLAGQLLASTTDPADLAEAVRKILGFLPKRWSGAVAAAISLTISFIPLLMDGAATIRDAALSRGLGRRGSIFRRAIILALPMAESALRRADTTAEALISRGFAEDPTEPELSLCRSDWLLLPAVTAPGLLALIADRLFK
jgi:energy-coupling factor transport system permease protein